MTCSKAPSRWTTLRTGAGQLLQQVRSTAKQRRIRPEHVFFGGEDYPSYAENFVRRLRQEKFLVVRVNAWEAKQQRSNFQASSDSLELLGIARCCLNRRGETVRDLPVAYTNLRIATRIATTWCATAQPSPTAFTATWTEFSQAF